MLERHCAVGLEKAMKRDDFQSGGCFLPLLVVICRDPLESDPNWADELLRRLLGIDYGRSQASPELRLRNAQPFI